MATFGTPTHNATASLGNGQTLKWREFEYLSGSSTFVGYENDPTVKASFNFDNKYDKSYFNHNVVTSNVDIVRRGYYFKGSGGITATSSDFTFGTGDFTVEFWLKKSSSPSNKQRLFGIGTFEQSGQFSIMLNNSNGGIILRKGTGAAQSEVLSDSTNICNNAWHHIAVTRSSTSLKLFIDGIQKQSVTDSTDFSQSVLQLGEDTGLDSIYDADLYDFSGYMSDILISKGVARYTSNFELPTKQFGRPDLKVKDSSGDYIIKLKQIN